MRDIIVSQLLVSSPAPPNTPWADIINSEEIDTLAGPKGAKFNNDLLLERSSQSEIKPAAILVLLIKRIGEFTILFTKRPEEMSVHAGQVSFPGGKIESCDHSPSDTALREAEEEVGLPREKVEDICRLKNHLIATGYRITPVVGIIESPVKFVCNPSEVAELFEMPLNYALDRENYRIQEMPSRGIRKKSYVIEYSNYVIWGATAAVLVNLRDIIRAAK